ncbi:MAG: response regulator [Lachnospiraceae bacterium]|nr:response regulator [Lachnospiraceae bacterium]
MGIAKKAKEIWSVLNRTIFVGDRLESNINVIVVMSGIITFIGTAMTVMNILQHKGFVTYTTAAIGVLGLISFIASKLYKNRLTGVIGITVLSILIFTYYSVMGVNEGFAILWTLLVPIALCFVGGVRIGILLSVYYEILFVILFYTPVRQYVSSFYTVTFMNRFPLLYLCGVLMVSVSMYNYHASTLKQMDYEVELKEAIDRAVAADAAKSRFLAQMSHEIRTPINAVLGMNEMILRESEDPDILEYSGNISTAGNTLLTLINSILDFSKIEDGKMELVPVSFDTAIMINNLIVAITPRAQAKGLDLNTDIDNSLPVSLIGDDVRISQVINNLLTNAVKYTEKGSVTVTVRNDGMDGKHAKIFVSVADTGIGIREEDKDKLFASFERLDVVRNRNVEGTGLGMSIVTRLLELMGSSLKVESVYGEGSVFSFTLELEVDDAQPIGDFSKRVAGSGVKRDSDELLKAPNARILVVDDNDMNLKVARGLLKLCRIKPDLAVSGFEAIDKMRENTYDIVFLDHMMPKMDGIETLKKLKEESLVPASTKMVALTANAIAGAREEYLAAGFDDYLAKPMVIGELEEKLVMYLPEEALSDMGTKEAGTPGRNGSDRKSPFDSTGNADEEAVLEFTAGSSDEEAVLEFPAGGSTEGNDVLEFSAGGIPDNEMADAEQNDFEQPPVYDLKKLADAGIDTKAGIGFCAGDKGFYAEMLSDYTGCAQEKGSALEDAYAQNDWKNYQVLVHALKSTSKTVGLMDIYELALALENAAKSEDAEFILGHHDDLMRIYRDKAAMIRRSALS